MGVRRMLATLGLLAVPPIGLGYAFETVVRRNLFRTTPHVDATPEGIGVPFEVVRFQTPDGQLLEGALFHGGDSPATVLFMHGTNYNASDMWASDDRRERFGEFLRGIGCKFFIFDYRGYGAHDGVTSEQGTYLDAEGALGYLYSRKDVDATRIVFYGFSMGTGVATELALREPCAGLILRAPFTSIRDTILTRYQRIRLPLTLAPWLPLSRFDNARKIGRIRTPLLIMHGDADSTVPQWMGRRLYELAREPKRFVSFPGAEHQDFPLELMVPAVREFLDEVAGARTSVSAAQ